MMDAVIKQQNIDWLGMLAKQHWNVILHRNQEISNLLQALVINLARRSSFPSCLLITEVRTALKTCFSSRISFTSETTRDGSHSLTLDSARSYPLTISGGVKP